MEGGVDFVDVQLAYSTSFYKSLVTGGNVSQALVSHGRGFVGVAGRMCVLEWRDVMWGRTRVGDGLCRCTTGGQHEFLLPLEAISARLW